jgi:thiol-disulfide isomerase/thioredoxin
MKIKLLLLALIVSSAVIGQTPEPAEKVFNDALAAAKKQNKNVMIIFHASWCGWCKKLDASMADPACSKFFEKNFVVAHLDIMEQEAKKNLENPGGIDMFNKYGGAGSGIPFFLIFDKNGILKADSKMRPEGAGLEAKGQNIGCPASDEEVAEFIKILKKVTKVSDKDAAAITERFRKNRS